MANGDNTARTRGLRAPWKPGESGNPGGRPKGSPEFRKRCREVAGELLERLCSAEPEEADKLVRAFEAVADRGGLIPSDREFAVLLRLMSVPGSEDQRQKLIEAYKASQTPDEESCE
jgi:hypothetical protein